VAIKSEACKLFPGITDRNCEKSKAGLVDNRTAQLLPILWQNIGPIGSKFRLPIPSGAQNVIVSEWSQMDNNILRYHQTRYTQGDHDSKCHYSD
jgi:hypothetical protein